MNEVVAAIGKKLPGIAALHLAASCREVGYERAKLHPRLLRHQPALVEGEDRVFATKLGRAVAYILFNDPKQAKRLEIAMEVSERSGCVKLSRARSTKVMVGLYRSVDAGIETDPEYPWTTVCEEHNNCVCHETRASAEAAMPHPEGWCDDCRDGTSPEDSDPS